MNFKQKRWWIAIVAAILTLLLAVGVSAEVKSGTIGSSNNINWSLDAETGVLTLTGSGNTGGFSSSSGRAP